MTNGFFAGWWIPSSDLYSLAFSLAWQSRFLAIVSHFGCLSQHYQNVLKYFLARSFCKPFQYCFNQSVSIYKPCNLHRAVSIMDHLLILMLHISWLEDQVPVRFYSRSSLWSFMPLFLSWPSSHLSCTKVYNQAGDLIISRAFNCVKSGLLTISAIRCRISHQALYVGFLPHISSESLMF